MKLKKWPETEVEYWEAIESLGGFIWKMEHDLCDGRIKDSTGGIDKDIIEARKISERLVSEISEKFNVIPPKDCPKVELGQSPPPAPPEGKIYYWDWYKKMKEQIYQMDYDKMICSACPFSEGVQEMIALGGLVPCGVFSGMIYRLTTPYSCAMVRSGEWDQEKLYQEIRTKGEAALTRFKRKEAELKSQFNTTTQKVSV